MNRGSPLHVLYVVPYVPTPIRTRPYNLIKSLLELGQRITLAFPYSSTDDANEIRSWRRRGVRVICAPISTSRIALNIVRNIASKKPFQSVYSWVPNLVQKIFESQEDGEPYDVVHVEHLRGAEYGIALLRSQLGRSSRPVASASAVPVIWDSVDCISALFSQAVDGAGSFPSRARARLELPRTVSYESDTARMMDATTVSSNFDRDAFLKLAGLGDYHPRIRVVANGVDTDYFSPSHAAKEYTNGSAPTLLFSGKMSYHANESAVLQFAESALPRLVNVFPRLTLKVVGKDPGSRIRRLADHPNIEVTGYVEDLRSHIRDATIAIAPITYGSGIQNKVLEAMACGIPVVASEIAARALEAEKDQAIVVSGAGDRMMVDSIEMLLRNHNHRKSIAEGGLAYVRRNHIWQEKGRDFVEIYREFQR